MAMDVSGQRVSLKVYDADTPEISFYYIYLYKQVCCVFYPCKGLLLNIVRRSLINLQH